MFIVLFCVWCAFTIAGFVWSLDNQINDLLDVPIVFAVACYLLVKIAPIGERKTGVMYSRCARCGRVYDCNQGAKCPICRYRAKT